MTYPITAKIGHVEGVVIVQGTTDSEGRVRDARLLSGPKALFRDSAENLKKWRFDRPRGGTVFVAYWFRFRGLCELPCLSGFEFYPPNLVVVTTGTPIVTE
jgi:outer membrane biosynthesis protein TonB